MEFLRTNCCGGLEKRPSGSFLLSAPLLCGLVAVSLGVSFVQVRALFAAEIIKPKFEKLNPLAGFQNIFFKPRTYLELGKNLLKLCIVAWLAYKFVGSSIQRLGDDCHLSA